MVPNYTDRSKSPVKWFPITQVDLNHLSNGS
jgi:hypothetical protein